MRVYERKASTTEGYAGEVLQRGQGTFSSKETRDAVARKLNEQGHQVRTSSISSQNLHPEYVTDYVGTVESGFGNSQYQMYWSRLYEISVSR